MDFFGDIGSGFFDGIGGGGKGFFEFIGKLFESGGGDALGDILGGAAGGGLAGESLFARILGLFDQGASLYIDYICWKDMLGNRGSFKDFQSAWKGMSEEGRANLEHIRDIVKGHSFILQQLETHHKDSEEIAKILAEYKNIGLNPPSGDLLQRVWG